jgi:hypothetical protein
LCVSSDNSRQEKEGKENMFHRFGL